MKSRNFRDENRQKVLESVGLFLVFIVVFSIAISLILTSAITDYYRKETVEKVPFVIQEQITEYSNEKINLSNYRSSETQLVFQEIAHHLETLSEVSRIVILGPNGLVYWSNDGLIANGSIYEQNNVNKSLTEGIIYKEAGEKVLATLGVKKAVEIYVPLTFSSGDIVVNTYFSETELLSALTRIRIIIFLFTALLFFAILLMLSYGLRTQKKIIKNQARKIQQYTHGLEVMVEDKVRELKTSEEEIKGISETVNAAIIAVNEQGRVVHWNRGAERMFGFKEEEVVGKTLDIIIPEKYRSAHNDSIFNFIKTGKTNNIGTSIEYEGMRKNGEVFPIELSLSSYKADGKQAVVALILDITKRKSAEVKYELLNKSISDVIWTMDLKLNYTYVSPSVQRQRGFTVEEVMRAGFEKTISPESISKMRNAYIFEMKRDNEPGIDKNRFIILEINEYRKDGSIFPAEINLSFLRDDNGKPVGILGVTRDITDRKNAERELENNKEELIRAQSVAQIGSWNLDILTGVLRWSKETYKIFGLSDTEEITLDRFYSFIHPEDRESVKYAWEGALHNKPYSIEHRILVKGEERWVLEIAEVDFDKFGKPLKGIGTVQDITKQKNDELAILESEERYKKLINLAPSGIVLHDGKKILFSNATGARILEADSAEALIGKKVIDFIHPDSQKIVKERIKNEIDNGVQSGSIHEKFITMRGRNIDVLASASPIKYLGTTAIMALFTDITKDKQSEDAVRISEEKLRTLIDALPDCIKLLDNNGNVIHISKGGMLEHGFSNVSEAIGWNYLKTFTQESEEKIQEALTEVKKGEIVNFDAEHTHKKVLGASNREWCNMTLAPVIDGNGKVINIVVISRDISEKRKMETKINLLDELKSRFITALTHVTRTPLSQMRWSIESLIAGELGDLNAEQIKFLYKILDSELDILQTITNMNMVLDVERGTMVLDKQDTSITSLVSSVMKSVVTECSIKQINCAVNLPKTLFPNIKIDAEKIRRVIEILVKNALQYSKKNGNITVNFGKTTKAVKIIISDNGVGIPEGEQVNIFDRFFRASNAQSLNTNGIGLGLYIVKSIVEAHNGQISFKSQEGVGTEFTVTLPL